MKKSLFFVATAAVVLASCSNDVKISENTVPVGSNAQKEIAFSLYSNTAKRLPILDGEFPTANDMQVAAYDAQNTIELFGATTFTYSGVGTIWHADPAKYWPLSAATINFLAYANFQGTAGSETTGATWGGTNHEAAGVTLVMTDNSSAQKDLMYAVGQGKVTQAGNALVIPDKVNMEFTHAQALLTFNVKANVASTITLKKITLNNAYYGGTLTIDNSNYSSTGAQSITSAAWGTLTNQKATFDIFDGTYAVTASSVEKADIMVVPNPSGASFDSFTLTYRIAGVDKDLTYTFTPTDRNLAKATKYVYDITFTLHEILISATVDTWDDGGTNHVAVPTVGYAYVDDESEAGTFTLPSATAGTYTCTITGLPADNYKAVIGTGTGEFITAVTPSTLVAVGDGEALNVSFTVTAATGKNQTVIIQNDEATPETLFTITVTQP